MTVRPRHAAAFALAATLALTACGSSSTPSAPAGTGAGSSASSSAPAPAPASGSAAEILAAALRKASEPGQTATMTMDGAGQSMSLDMETGPPQKMSGTFSLDGEDVKMVLVDGVVSLGGMPGMTELPAGKKWITFGGDSDDPVSAAVSAGLAKSVSQMQTASADLVAKSTITDLGEATLNGAVTRRVKMVTPAAVITEQSQAAMKAMLDKLPAEARASAEEAMKNAVTGDVVQEYWIDPATSLPLKAATEMTTAGKKATTTLNYTWGVPVSIAAPPADEVVTFGELLKGMMP